MNSLKAAFLWGNACIVQLVRAADLHFKERLLRSFSGFCAAYFSELTRGKLICAALRRVARFCSQIFADRRNDREKFFACALHRKFNGQ